MLSIEKELTLNKIICRQMTNIEDVNKKELVELVDRMTKTDGIYESGIRGVHLIRISHLTPRYNIIYEPSIAIVIQGGKKGYIGDDVYTYNANNYLVLSVPLPFESEITEASPQKPLLAIDISVDTNILAELIIGMKEDLPSNSHIPRSIYSTPMTRIMVDATLRLLQSSLNPNDCRILGPQIKREILYRVLCGKQGESLRAVTANHSSSSQIAKVLSLIHLRYAENMDVKTMAKTANMSISSFHHNFKKVTAISPLQYLKRIRLHKARMFMLQERLNVSMTAERVGYTSLSQFSREFKRFFGTNPSNEVAN